MDRSEPNTLPPIRTKIVATIGPASRDPAVLRRLIDGGVNVFRLNFSHGTHDEHSAVPLHLISPQGRLAVPKVRAFVDFAVPRLKAHFFRLASDAARQQRGIQPPHGASRGVGYVVAKKGELNGRKPERDCDDQYAVDKVL